jgi:hypothetical protein
MAQLKRSVVCLRIFGDDLIPDEVTNLLGVAPTKTELKGEKITGRTSGNVRFAKTGGWRFNVADREPEDMDGQIQELFNQMTGNIDVWRDITNRYHVDLFCGLFMGVSNEGLTLSPRTLASIGERGITMGFDIYAGQDDENETNA